VFAFIGFRYDLRDSKQTRTRRMDAARTIVYLIFDFYMPPMIRQAQRWTHLEIDLHN